MFEHFIDIKSQQLIYYISGYFSGRLAYSELHLFIWDTLEEWAQHKLNYPLECSAQERVFWHLLHQLEFWPEPYLQYDLQLRQSIQDCLRYLKGYGIAPKNCVGIRP
ncbi:hypothetical protein [Rheinheimera salexigens]|uniref:Uncharacterized protein n=1 Tax=Rheinheimera salexigens TaxID=1628148 RepID=A0A1E7Q4D7_9GAMM|nr:hypothetical protein [Rheinheimera salexigens]OEY69064.1 hypothetical protein BI198_05370 [Rheinheimera salexigens]